MSTQQVPLRSEIAVKHTWSIESVFATPALWEAACEAVLAQLPTVAAFAGTLGSSPARLAEWMDFYQQINKAAQQLSMYAFLEYSTDTTNVAAAARTGKAGSIGAEVEAALAFAEPELMAIGFATLKRWVAETAALADYGAYFDDLERQAAHVRSAEVEEVLGLVQDAFRTATNTHGILTNSELAFVAAQAADGECAKVHGNIMPTPILPIARRRPTCCWRGSSRQCFRVACAATGRRWRRRWIRPTCR
jgi:oligoendopeptidase F